MNTRRPRVPRHRSAQDDQYRRIRDQLRAERAQRERDRLDAAAAADPPDYGPLDLTSEPVRAALLFDHQHGVKHHGLPCCSPAEPAERGR